MALLGLEGQHAGVGTEDGNGFARIAAVAFEAVGFAFEREVETSGDFRDGVVPEDIIDEKIKAEEFVEFLEVAGGFGGSCGGGCGGGFDLSGDKLPVGGGKQGQLQGEGAAVAAAQADFGGGGGKIVGFKRAALGVGPRAGLERYDPKKTESDGGGESGHVSTFFFGEIPEENENDYENEERA
jgi:hypothetical protein